MQTEHLENHTARITVEVDPERVEKAMRQAGRKIAQKARIPGFRPGKAPYAMIERAFGREYILNEALDDLGQEIYREALDQEKIEPYAPGSLENIETEGGLKLTFIVPKQPTIELGEYRDQIRVPYEVEEVTDDTVNQAMEEVRQNNALLEPVDREAKMGDQITFDHFEVIVLAEDEDEDDDDDDDDEEEDDDDESGDEDEESEDDDDEEDDDDDDEDDDDDDDHEHDHDHEGERVLIHQHQFDRVLRDDEEDMFPGFSAHFVGAKVGDEIDFTLTLPEDHDVEDLRGRTIRVEGTIEKVQARTVPEWSDALAEQWSDGKLKTMLEFRVDLRQQLEAQAKYNADQKVADEAMNKLVENATFSYPEEAVQDVLSDLLNDLDGVLQQQGLRLNDYMRIMNKTDEDLRNEYRDRAVERLRRSLALSEFVVKEGLVIRSEDIDAEIEQTINLLGGDQADRFRQFLTTPQSRMNIANRLASTRAMTRLAAIAKGENPPIDVEEAPADEAAETTEEAAPEAEPTAEAADTNTEATE